MKHLKLFLLFIIAVSLMIACRKALTVDNIESETFLHVYHQDSDEYAFHIIPTSDQGFLLVSSTDYTSINDGKKLNLKKVDSHGLLQWSKSFNDTIYEPNITNTPDGNFILSSSYYQNVNYKINESGDVLFRSEFFQGSTYRLFEKTVIGEDGMIYAPETNGGSTGAASTNIVRWYTPDGQYKSGIQLNDTIFGGKMYVLKMFRQENPRIFYFYGIMYVYPFQWSNNPRLFVAKVEYNNFSFKSKKVTIIDPTNKTNKNSPFLIGYTYLESVDTKDKGLVISTFQNSPQGMQNGYVAMIDSNLNLKWDHHYNVGILGTMPKFVGLNLSGNILIGGSCFNGNKKAEQPFVLEYSQAGEMISSKIFEMDMGNTFNGFTQLKNGSYVFCGTSNGFGKGGALNDLFVMKTDKNFNIK